MKGTANDNAQRDPRQTIADGPLEDMDTFVRLFSRRLTTKLGTPTFPRLTARNLKCTLVLNAAEIAEIGDVGTSRVPLHINVDGRIVTADIASKSLRKAQSLIAEHNTITEAGLVAQVKAPQPAPVEAAT